MATFWLALSLLAVVLPGATDAQGNCTPLTVLGGACGIEGMIGSRCGYIDDGCGGRLYCVDCSPHHLCLNTSCTCEPVTCQVC
eukprot:COSAG05_NODE_287_length_12131_cov_3.148022_14_plen_83_part_00